MLLPRPEEPEVGPAVTEGEYPVDLSGEAGFGADEPVNGHVHRRPLGTAPVPLVRWWAVTCPPVAPMVRTSGPRSPTT